MKAFFTALIVLLATATVALAGLRVVDASGRGIVLDRPLTRVVLADSLDVLSLSFVRDDPVAAIAGWAGRYRLDDPMFQAIQSRFPAVADIPSVGEQSALSAETIIALRPDAVLLGNGNTRSDPALTIIEAAGIPTIFISPPAGQPDPTRDAVERKIGLLGQLFGEADRAERLISLHRPMMAQIAAAVAGRPKPLMLLEAHGGSIDCCWSPGSEADYVDFIGARNLGSDEISINAGKLSLEYILTRQPDLVVATGGVHMRAENGLVLGVGVGSAEAERGLKAMMARRVFAGLNAVKQRRVYGFWHLLPGTPWDIVAWQAMVNWAHPDLSGDQFQPLQTLRQINALSSLPLDGTFLISGARND